MALAILRAVLYLLCAGATFYAILAIVAARDFFSSEAPAPDAAFHPGISILKLPARSRTRRKLPFLLRGGLPRLPDRSSARSRGPGPAAAGPRPPGMPGRGDRHRAERRGRSEPKVATRRHGAARPPRDPARLRQRRGPERLPGGWWSRPLIRRSRSPRHRYRVAWLRTRGLLQALGNATEFQLPAFVARKVEGCAWLGAGIQIRREALRGNRGFAEVSRYRRRSDARSPAGARRAPRRDRPGRRPRARARASASSSGARFVNRGSARPDWPVKAAPLTQSSVAAVLLPPRPAAARWTVVAPRSGCAWRWRGRSARGSSKTLSVRRWILLGPLRDSSRPRSGSRAFRKDRGVAASAWSISGSLAPGR